MNNLFVKVEVSVIEDLTVDVSLQDFFNNCSKEQSHELQTLSYRRDGLSNVEGLYGFLTTKQKLDLFALLKIETEYK